MQSLLNLIQIIETLLGPQGCPWDREQTLHTLRRSLIEETYEVVEAIDKDAMEELKEEVGDLFFNVLFICKLAEKNQSFTIEDSLNEICAKLIRRHPHVFGDAEVAHSDDVVKQWDAIKQQEKGATRTSALDGIPKELPALARAQCMIKKIAKTDFKPPVLSLDATLEEKEGQKLWEYVERLSQYPVLADQALRKRLTQIESQFREYELST